MPGEGALCVVLGGGPVGFLVAEMLRADGRACVVVEPQEGRREALRSLGHTVEPDVRARRNRAGVWSDASKDLAEKTGSSECYEREWLNAQAAGGFVE